jgi:NADPH-dependent F420 reductase
VLRKSLGVRMLTQPCIERGTIGVVGGTGPAGSGLAARFACAGHTVMLGSRDITRADTCVAELRARWGERVDGLRSATNEQACAADVVLIATVADALVDTAEQLGDALDGRVVVSIGNALRRTARGFEAVVPAEGSLAAAIQRVAPNARVVGAFQNLPAEALHDLDRSIEADVVVCGNDADAVHIVMRLAEAVVGLTARDGGPLRNAMALEALTAVLITVNRTTRGEHAIRFVDLQEASR